jgi:hypothetical protein
MSVLENIFPPKSNKKDYRKGNIKLRFTNCRFLNDPYESLVLPYLLVKNEEDVIKHCGCSKEDFDKNIKNNKDCFWDSYTFSMSYLKNSSVFWESEYVGNNGVAIIFNTKKFKEEIEGEQSGRFEYVDYSESIENIYKSADLRYNETNKKISEMFKPKSDKFPDKLSALIYSLGYFSCFYKLASWEHEKEVRAVLVEVKDDEEKINPEIEVAGNEIRKVLYKYFDEGIVNSIILSPSCSDEHTKLVKDYLAKNGYSNIEVSKSKESSSKKGVSL